MRIAPVDYIYPRCSVYPRTLGDAEQSSSQHPHIPDQTTLTHILLLGNNLAYLLLSSLFVSNKTQEFKTDHTFFRT